ncbi:MAG: hypothetical protein AVDCRST_MAG66-215 [uncultured Pseudonocardia sp.]|uniref:Uncharacterized protein n=1 Tax=uncultured Pseudonocardia sp. TaxID=211455 RepID=A0A6J4N7I9_9PSEU|nr:MAG: hypothetical protein AVDCRST_MAG66-215 [uncultured Pseudonocardia sp.]
MVAPCEGGAVGRSNDRPRSVEDSEDHDGRHEPDRVAAGGRGAPRAV